MDAVMPVFTWLVDPLDDPLVERSNDPLVLADESFSHTQVFTS